MTITLRPAPAEKAQILPFPNTQADSMAAAMGQIHNIQVALAGLHGPRAARLMLAEAAVQVIARTARDSGNLVPTRFALEVEIDNAFNFPPGMAG